MATFTCPDCGLSISGEALNEAMRLQGPVRCNGLHRTHPVAAVHTPEYRDRWQAMQQCHGALRSDEKLLEDIGAAHVRLAAGLSQACELASESLACRTEPGQQDARWRVDTIADKLRGILHVLEGLGEDLHLQARRSEASQAAEIGRPS